VLRLCSSCILIDEFLDGSKLRKPVLRATVLLHHGLPRRGVLEDPPRPWRDERSLPRRPEDVLGGDLGLRDHSSRWRWWLQGFLGFSRRSRPLRALREPQIHLCPHKGVQGQHALSTRIGMTLTPPMKCAPGHAKVFHRPRGCAGLNQEPLQKSEQISQHRPTIAEAPARRAEAALVEGARPECATAGVTAHW